MAAQESPDVSPDPPAAHKPAEVSPDPSAARDAKEHKPPEVSPDPAAAREAPDVSPDPAAASEALELDVSSSFGNANANLCKADGSCERATHYTHNTCMVSQLDLRLAPPCKGPYNAAIAEEVAEKGSL